MNIRVRELGISNLIQACGQATAPFQLCGQITAFCPTASAPWVARERAAIDHEALRAQLRKALGH